VKRGENIEKKSEWRKI